MPSRRSRHGLIALIVAGPLAAGIAASPALSVEAPPTKGFDTDVALTKSADRSTYLPGDTITYTLTVTNVGHTTIDTARIRVSDPSVDYVLRAGGADTLAPGESLAYTATRTTTAANCGLVTNTATV
ncbi:unnamed protein product, partial [Phaeothamnion confervicola]